MKRVVTIEMSARDYADVADLAERHGMDRHRIIAQIVTDWLDANLDVNVRGRGAHGDSRPLGSLHHHEKAITTESSSGVAT
jgi:hypothetical protein